MMRLSAKAVPEFFLVCRDSVGGRNRSCKKPLSDLQRRCVGDVEPILLEEGLQFCQTFGRYHGWIFMALSAVAALLQDVADVSKTAGVTSDDTALAREKAMIEAHGGLSGS